MMDAAPDDPDQWTSWVERRLEGEPLEWIIGYTEFMGHRVWVDPGVYVPRLQTELIAGRAIDALPDDGVAVDLCTGSGAIAVAMREARPGARIVATEIDRRAGACAEKNGVELYRGHLAEPIPTELWGRIDVVVAVVPYVPTDEIIFLPRDVRDHEPLLALDGGNDGMVLLDQAVAAGARILRPGGSLVLEVGGHQDALLERALDDDGFDLVERILDEDGDLRGVWARLREDRRYSPSS